MKMKRYMHVFLSYLLKNKIVPLCCSKLFGSCVEGEDLPPALTCDARPAWGPTAEAQCVCAAQQPLSNEMFGVWRRQRMLQA